MIRMEESVSHMVADMTTLKVDVSEIRAMANRWRGGFIVALAVGGLLGWVVDKIAGLRGLWS